MLLKNQPTIKGIFMSDFEKLIKPHYHLLEDADCYLVYSTNRHLSIKSDFYQKFTSQVKQKFGFKLLCEDLVKSYHSATKYIHDHNLQGYTTPVGYKTTLSNSMEALVVHKLSNKIGYGLSSGGTLEKGTIIAEYIGEKIPSQHRASDNTYVFLSDDNTYVDSKTYGNVARFISHCPNNHSNENVMTANLASLVLPISKDFNTIFFMTLRDIKEFEPLCYDYGAKYTHKDSIELLHAETYLPIQEL